ncbi:MAG: toprim domain-containing protein [Saprospiraceae bacterium]|nr:toprim domain-containing protein [Saprospiraceae bacterium]
MYPKYPRENTQKLIITESIIDAATIFQLHLDNVDNQITTVLALYGTNGWTDEHTTAIQALPELNEIIFFLNGDEAGQKAVQKYAPMMKSTYPKVKVSNVEVPHNEDVNSLLDSHSEEIIIHLIKERKEIEFLFSTEKSNENKKTEQAESPIFAREEVEVNTITSTPEEKENQVKTNGLDTQNPYNLKYASEAASYQIKGFKTDQMDSLKITLQIALN